jgi:AP endonuclease 1
VYEETWREFDKVVGFKYLAGLHLNDSRSTLGSQRDLHANLGYPSSSTGVNYSRGFLSLEAFRLIVNDEKMKSIPMILETPAPEEEIWAEEIKLLYWMVGKDTGDPELLEREAKLQELGKEDREKQLGVLKRKAEKAAKPPRRKKTKTEEISSSEESEEEEDHMH